MFGMSATQAWLWISEIALKTIPIVLFGERVSTPLIEQAWNDLGDSGIVKGELMSKIKDRLFEMPSQV